MIAFESILLELSASVGIQANEAIEWNDDNIEEMSAHYDYLRNHSDIIRMIEVHTKK